MANENERLEVNVEASAKKADSELDGIVSTLRDLLSSVKGISGTLDKINGSLGQTDGLAAGIAKSLSKVSNIKDAGKAGEQMAKGYKKAAKAAKDVSKAVVSSSDLKDYARVANATYSTFSEVQERYATGDLSTMYFEQGKAEFQKYGAEVNKFTKTDDTAAWDESDKYIAMLRELEESVASADEAVEKLTSDLSGLLKSSKPITGKDWENLFKALRNQKKSHDLYAGAIEGFNEGRKNFRYTAKDFASFEELDLEEFKAQSDEIYAKQIENAKAAEVKAKADAEAAAATVEYEKALKKFVTAGTAAEKTSRNLTLKFMDGGVLKNSEDFIMNEVAEDYVRAREDFVKAIKSAKSHGVSVDESLLEKFRGVDTKGFNFWNEQNKAHLEFLKEKAQQEKAQAKAARDAAKAEEAEAKEFESLNAQLQTLLKNYQALLRRRKTKIADGNGWSERDIDRAHQMAEQVLDLASRLEEYGKAGRKAAAVARAFVGAQPKDAGGTGGWGRIISLAEQIPYIGTGFSFVRRNAKKALDVLTKFGTKVGIFTKLRSAVNKLGKSFGMTLKFYLSFGLISDVMSSFSTVSKYAAQSNDKLNQSLSNVTQGYANIKAAASSALLPLIQWIAPAVTNAMNAISESIHRIGMALAALAGQDTYTKMTADVLGYADGLNEASGALASFDKLNILGSSSQERSYTTEEIKLEDNEFYSQLKRLGSAAKDTASGIGDVFASALDTLGQHITGNADFSILESARTAFEKLANFINSNAPAIGSVIGGLGSLAWEIGSAFADAALDVIGFFAGFLPGDTASEKLEKVATWLENVANWLKDNRELVSALIKTWWGISFVGKLLDSTLVRGLTSILGLLGKVGKGLWTVVSGAFTNSKLGLFLQEANEVGGLGVKLSAMWAPFGTKVKAAMATAGTAVKDFATTAGTKIASGFSTAASSVGTFMTQSVASAGALSTGIVGITSAVAGLSAGFLIFYKAFGKGLDDVKNDLNVWKNATAEDILYVFKYIGNTVLNFFENAVNSITNLFSNLWSWVTSKISSIGSKISSMVSGVKTTNSGRSGYSIRSYASGGIINRGQLFRANESGPELVGSLDGKTAVANQSQVYNAMYDGIYRAMLRAMNMSGGNGGGDIYLTAELDGDKVYSSVVKRNKSKYRQTGKNPLTAY